MPQESQELRFQNVCLHGHGDKQHGTLHLRKHHLCFRYYPDSKTAADPGSSAYDGAVGSPPTKGRTGMPTERSTVTEASAESAGATSSAEPRGSGDLSAANGSPAGEDSAHAKLTKDKQKDERPMQRPKELWVPYPLINHCVLRPSHSLSQTVHSQRGDGPLNLPHEDDDEFPPSFGTATYDRPSSDSARLAPYSSPQRSASPGAQGRDAAKPSESGRQPAIRIRCKDFRMMALHFHASQSGTLPDETARQVFYTLRSRCCVDRVEDLHAFHFDPPKQESVTAGTDYDACREYVRMGISGKAADGPGTAWRVTDINHDYSYSATYPNVLCVPRSVSDNLLKYGGVFRSRSRIPCLAYLHTNGGSITRSSQPMVGVQSKRNPQDERLVSAIFSSHTPPLQSTGDSPPQLPSLTSPSMTTLESNTSDPAIIDSDIPALPISQSETALHEKGDDKTTPLRKKVYGSTRRNLIIDARPKINALANRATGGGIEDVSNYLGTSDIPVERVFLNIANIHVMRTSLEKVVDSFANSDYIKMRPDQEALRKSGWLGHIGGTLDGAEMVARVVGLGGSHVLIHCSDGWDRTSQVSALAQVMLDPHYRTLDGFIALMQKDFLSFGHKFRDRNGIEGSEKWFEIENERIAPSRNREGNNSDPTSLNVFGAKALTGAKHWFEKNRSNLFRQQNQSQESLADRSPSRPSSPPPNPIIHSPPTSTRKDEKEHKMNEKEIAPIFHQFLDAVYQLQYQHPDAFEFNERCLRRLFYHTYACQYGEFLFNTEKERAHHRSKVGSVWAHFLSRKHEFINPEYVAKVDDPLLFPKRQGPDREVDVRWWSGLFQRKDEEMNLPRALAPADPPAITLTLGSSVSFDERAVPDGDDVGTTTASHSTIKESKSTPNLSATNDIIQNGNTSLNIQSNEQREESTTTTAQEQKNVGFEMVSKQASKPQPETNGEINKPQTEQMEMWEDGDPLGVTGSMSQKPEDKGLDFATFASENAFRDR